MNLENKVYKVLPTKASKALTCHELATGLGDYSELQVRKAIKSLRASGIPVTWNNRGSYITYDKKELALKQKQIDNAKAGFAVGMNKIKNVYQNVIDTDITINLIGEGKKLQ